MELTTEDKERIEQEAEMVAFNPGNPFTIHAAFQRGAEYATIYERQKESERCPSLKQCYEVARKCDELEAERSELIKSFGMKRLWAKRRGEIPKGICVSCDQETEVHELCLKCAIKLGHDNPLPEDEAERADLLAKVSEQEKEIETMKEDYKDARLIIDEKNVELSEQSQRIQELKKENEQMKAEVQEYHNEIVRLREEKKELVEALKHSVVYVPHSRLLIEIQSLLSKFEVPNQHKQ